MWLWPFYLTSLNLSFLICRVELLTPVTGLPWGVSGVMFAVHVSEHPGRALSRGSGANRRRDGSPCFGVGLFPVRWEPFLLPPCVGMADSTQELIRGISACSLTLCYNSCQLVWFWTSQRVMWNVLCSPSIDLTPNKGALQEHVPPCQALGFLFPEHRRDWGWPRAFEDLA